MIALAVFTDGRGEFISQSIPRYEETLRGPITHRFIFDDSANADYSEWLHEQYAPRYAVISWKERLGFGGTIAAAWGFLAEIPQFDYVFHAEDDFWLDVPVDLDKMMLLLASRPRLDQVALLRHAFFPRELEAGGIIQEHPGSYHKRELEGLRWLEHTRYFTTNPCVYRRELCTVGWPAGDASEQVFTKRRVAAGQRFAYWEHGLELSTHIGIRRAGVGY